MKQAIRFTLMILAFALCQLAAAQSYSIRAEGRYNLRAEPSLQGPWVETVATGTILQVSGATGSWLQIDRNGRVVWMADWLRYTRIEGVSQPEAQTPVDNCCFVDRQCVSDQDWTDGYWAYQNGQCAAPGQTQGQASPQPAGSAPANVNNCCFVDRQCHSDQDWTDGFWAYQQGQCAGVPPHSHASPQPISVVAPASYGQADNCCFIGWQCNSDQDWQEGYRAFQNKQCGVPDGIDNCCQAGWQCDTDQDWQRGWAAYRYFRCSDEIPMRIEGSSTFVRLMRDAFNLLKRKSSRLYNYGITGVNMIRQGPADEGTGFYDDGKILEHGFEGDSYGEYDVVYAVGAIAHEACHGHQLEDGTATTGWSNELPCMQVELEAYQAVDPTDRHGLAAWAQDIITNIRNPSYWWW